MLCRMARETVTPEFIILMLQPSPCAYIGVRDIPGPLFPILGMTFQFNERRLHTTDGAIQLRRVMPYLFCSLFWLALWSSLWFAT